MCSAQPKKLLNSEFSWGKMISEVLSKGLFKLIQLSPYATVVRSDIVVYRHVPKTLLCVVCGPKSIL